MEKCLDDVVSEGSEGDDVLQLSVRSDHVMDGKTYNIGVMPKGEL